MTERRVRRLSVWLVQLLPEPLFSITHIALVRMRVLRMVTLGALTTNPLAAAGASALLRRAQAPTDGQERSRSEMMRSWASGHAMPKAGSSQRTPRAASGTKRWDIE